MRIISAWLVIIGETKQFLGLQSLGIEDFH